MQIGTSAISSSPKISGPQFSLYLVGLGSSTMQPLRCLQSANLCYCIHMRSFVVFRNTLVNHFEIYHLALISAFRMDLSLCIRSWAITIIGLTNPLSISGPRVCLCHFQSCLAHIPAVFDPRITYEGLKLDFANDPVLLADLNKSKLRLCEYYNKYYATLLAPSRDISNVHPKSSCASDFTAHYESIIPDSIDKLEEYLKIKCKDFKKCDPLRWWRSQREDWPNLYHLACDVLCIPGS